LAKSQSAIFYSRLWLEFLQVIIKNFPFPDGALMSIDNPSKKAYVEDVIDSSLHALLFVWPAFKYVIHGTDFSTILSH
jgi:hypothetical protein